MWPRRQPRWRLVSLLCRCLYLCCTGCCHWRIDATLRTHFVVVDDIHCGLSTHLSLRSQGIVPQQYLLRCFTPPLCPMLRATCRSLKYYNKFASCVRSLVPYNTSRGLYLALPASSCFLLRPSPLHSVFTVKQLLLARWLHVRCFLSLPLTLPTQCFLLPWNVAESSETSCCVLQGLLQKRVDSFSFNVAFSAANCVRLKRPVASPRICGSHTRTGWEYPLTVAAARATSEAERRAWTAHSNTRVCLLAPADAGVDSRVV